MVEATPEEEHAELRSVPLSGQPTFETQAPDLELELLAFEGEATPEEECEEDVFNFVAQCF